MARHVTPASKDPTASAAAEELDILHPERVLTFGKHTFVIREYGAVEWLRLIPVAKPMLDAIERLLDGGIVPSYQVVSDLFAEHADLTVAMLAQAADVTEEDFAVLKPDQLDEMLIAWWGANGRFFIGRAVGKIAVAREEARLVRSAGASSTQPSSRTGTIAPTSDA